MSNVTNKQESDIKQSITIALNTVADAKASRNPQLIELALGSFESAMAVYGAYERSAGREQALREFNAQKESEKQEVKDVE